MLILNEMLAKAKKSRWVAIGCRARGCHGLTSKTQVILGQVPVNKR
jgi:hypothetical protein